MIGTPAATQNTTRSRALVVLGAGHFGQRAVRLLGGKGRSQVWVVDKDERSLTTVRRYNVKVIQDDAVDYLVRHKGVLSRDTNIVPAVPFHLAWRFAQRVLEGVGYSVRAVTVPAEIKSSLPHVWDAADGSFLVSYAEFRCPDDCPEPLYCTVTGERRDKPLYELLQGITAEGFRVYVIRSRQMAPGLGGYDMADLLKLCTAMEEAGPGKWLVGTACRCHGVLSGLEVEHG